MKKILLTLLLIFLCSFTLIACGESPKEEIPETPVVDVFEGIEFADLTTDYDGVVHMPELTGLPESATVAFSPKKGKKDAGSYDYKATVTIGEESKEFTATLTINALTPVITAPLNQTVYINDGTPTLECSSSIALVDVQYDNSVLYEIGTHEVVLTTKASNNYKAAEPVTVTVVVKQSELGYHFTSTDYVMNEDPITIDSSLIEGFDASKYDVSFSKSTFTEQGIYHVTATISDKATSKEIESYRAIITVDYPDNEEFKTYESEAFIYFLSGDQLTLNIFMEDYEAFGFEHQDAEWYAYDPYTDEEYASDCTEVQSLREECDSFASMKLSFAQLNTYTAIDYQIRMYEGLLANKNNILMRLTYVDQYGGYCSNFASEMEAYSYRTIQDVEDSISYINSTYDSYLSYYDFIVDREEAGYGLSKFTLDNFCEFLDGIAKEGEDYYLIGIMKKKVADAKVSLSLSDEQVADYQDQIETAFTEKFIPAHEDLSEKVKTYVKKASLNGYLKDFKEGYLINYEGGDELYEALLRDRLGIYDQTIEEYIAYLESSLKTFMGYWSTSYTKLNKDSTAKSISDGKVKIIESEDPQDLIAYLKEFAKTIVPDLKSNPTIGVTYMDKTATANTTTAAYYMKSPIDSDDEEFIHLNEASLGSNYINTLSTLAHEGYPGHLYAYVLTKESDSISNVVVVNTNTGFGEGWAKYVEIALGNYIADQKGSESWQIAMDYNAYYDLMCYCLYARIDVGIGYQGWGIKKIAEYLGSVGLNDSIAENLFQTLIEIPGQYAPYGYGQALFYNLHEEAKAALGVFYDEIDFNTALLAHGWVDIDSCIEYVNQYIEGQKFLYNIQ